MSKAVRFNPKNLTGTMKELYEAVIEENWEFNLHVKHNRLHMRTPHINVAFWIDVKDDGSLLAAWGLTLRVPELFHKFTSVSSFIKFVKEKLIDTLLEEQRISLLKVFGKDTRQLYLPLH